MWLSTLWLPMAYLHKSRHFQLGAIYNTDVATCLHRLILVTRLALIQSHAITAAWKAVLIHSYGCCEQLLANTSVHCRGRRLMPDVPSTRGGAADPGVAAEVSARRLKAAAPAPAQAAEKKAPSEGCQLEHCFRCFQL